MSSWAVTFVNFWLWSSCRMVGTSWAFSNPSSDSSSLALFDRFRHQCPADIDNILQYDVGLLEKGVENAYADESTWVAVFRSNSNNKPSVLIRDEFLNAMRVATSVVPSDDLDHGSASTTSSISPLITSQSRATERPVAVARLQPSKQFPGSWMLDSMRCSLKKEDTNSDCDGGSEHTEALSVGIDASLLYYLKHTNKKNHERFEGAIRTKATLVSGALVEERGFRPVEELCGDMATHVSSLDACMEAYADRVVSAKHPAARERALRIVSFLGSLDRTADMERAAQERLRRDEDNESDDEDPWAAMKKYL